MNERERLIEILKDNQGDDTYYMTNLAAEKIVSVLLENGVVVLPYIEKLTVKANLDDLMNMHLFLTKEEAEQALKGGNE